MEKHLGNESLYRPCHDLTKKAEEDINEVWEYVTRKNRVNERSIGRLKIGTQRVHVSAKKLDSHFVFS
jgi:hypothetical protein